MIRLRENAVSAILTLCPALSNKSRCGRRFDGAPFLCFGRIDFHASEANVRLFPTHASEFRHTADGYQRKLEKEQSFVPFPLRSECFRYSGDLVVREYAVTFFFYFFR